MDLKKINSLDLTKKEKPVKQPCNYCDGKGRWSSGMWESYRSWTCSDCNGTGLRSLK